MPQITINGKPCDFKPGQMILDVANANGLAIPQYCYHPGLSIVASCRICLAECWAPNPRNNNKLESMGKLLPTCQTACTDGMVVYTDSPKAIQNQKAVMEYLLINHPLDCPVCDQAGECSLQDYSYEYGRGVSRFEETKVKQPKKDLGPHVYLSSDRCIMCTRCVRFTREVSGTAELMVEGRGNAEQIDVFPGVALDNELSANVIDLCPVGALLDKDFLFTQRVWFLKSTPSIDGITASGDNILIEHNEGKVYRVKPRDNPEVNKWWISDEIRYGWKFVHSPDRLKSATHVKFGKRAECELARAYAELVEGVRLAVAGGKRLALMVSPMLSCEEAYLLAKLARKLDPRAVFAVGPVPRSGADKTFPGGYTVYAEKCPNARGVRRVLEAVGGAAPMTFEDLAASLKKGSSSEIGAVILTGNFPSDWVTPDFAAAVAGAMSAGAFTAVIDTLPSRLTQSANIVLPGATWAEKAGTFENAKGRLQAFEQAIPVSEGARAEGQVALDVLALLAGVSRAEVFNAADVRREMAGEAAPGGALSVFETDVHYPTVAAKQEAEVAVVEL